MTALPLLEPGRRDELSTCLDDEPLFLLSLSCTTSMEMRPLGDCTTWFMALGEGTDATSFICCTRLKFGMSVH